ncbi:MAG: hypothetical protein WD207_02755 [Xanthobacteraceae bacterium]
MRCLLRPAIVLAALAFAAPVAAQGKVKTETVSPKAPAPAKSDDAAKADKPAALPEIINNLSRLPDKVRRTRERILEAAKTGDLNKVATVMQSNEMMPVFSFGGGKNPVEFWQNSYPDSDGVEALAILIEILEMPFVHLDRGSPQEMYVWPYFYGLPLNRLTPEQKVELFRLITGTDWREMLDFGAYIFFRVGISPDGVWHFFVAGD